MEQPRQVKKTAPFRQLLRSIFRTTIYVRIELLFNELWYNPGMTLILNLSSAEEARLAAAARQAGLAPDALLKSLLNDLPLNPEADPAPQISQQASAREAAIRAARGSMAYVGASVEDLHQQRQADKNREQDKGH